MGKLTFTDVFEVDELQRLQDLFSEANEVASIITHPDGTPITQPSNFCTLCYDIIRKSEKGAVNCYKSDALIGRYNPDGPIVQKCLSAGLMDAGVSITIGDQHIANWLIGQVRNNEVNEEDVIKYAREIDVDPVASVEAFRKVPQMSKERFNKIAEMLFAFVNELSDKAFKNLQLQKEKEIRETAVLYSREKERELKSARDEIKIVSENLPNIIWKTEITPEGKYVNSYISEIADELLLLQKGTINNDFDKFLSYVVPDYLPKLQKLILEAIQFPGKAYSILCQIKKANNELAWFESTGRGYVFDGIPHLFGITVDVTEKIEKENKLNESELLLLESQKIANIGSYNFEIETGKWGNTIFLDEMFGIDNSYPKTVDGWLKLIHPDDRQMMKDYFLNEVIGKGKEFNKQYRIVNNLNGQIIWVQGLGRLEFNESGEPLKMIGTIQNINDRKLADELLKESENRYRTLLENLPVGVFRSSLNGIILSANSAMAEIYGYNSIEDLLNAPAKNHYTSEYPRELLLKNLLKKGYLLDYETLEVKKDGTQIWVSANYKLVTDEKTGDSYIDGVIMDITDRKKNEEAISLSEERFRSIAEQTADLIALTDETGIIKYASPASKHIFGCSPEEMEGNMFVDFLDVSELSRANDSFRELMTEGKKYSDQEYKLKRVDGSFFTGEVSGSLFHVGQHFGVITVIRDITERKKAETELIDAKIRAEQGEARFKALHDASFGGIGIHDKGIILDCNSGLSEITGYSRDELIGMNGLLLIAEEYRKTVLDYITADYDKSYEVSGVKKTGEVYPLRIQGKNIPYQGMTVRVTEFRDMTEIKKAEETLKQSEENFRLLVSNTFDGILINDENGNYLYANKKAAEITGYSVEELTKINTSQLTPERFKNAVENRIATQFAQKEDLSNFEAVLIHKSGKEVMIEISASLTTWKGIQAQIISFRDITLRKKNELELIEAKQKAEESDRLKSAFLANMSHEIRTPMNGILGFTGLLQNPDLSGEEQQSYIEIIQKSGNRLLSTVNDIIEISKIETGQVTVSMNKINIDDQMDYLYNFFSPEVASKGIQLNMHNEVAAANSTFRTDDLKLNSVLTNLIKNAIKFSESGSIDVSCRLIGKQLQFEVKDTGIGIPPERLQAIFERFVQADIADTRAHEGSGLGLAISKSYVEMLGGKLWVESKLNEGSTFYFTIDFIPGEIQTDTLQRNLHESESEKVKEQLILVAEDEDISYLLMNSILSQENYQVLRAKSGKEAVEFARNNPEIDLVLMDVKMPEMGGLEATEQIRKFNSKVPIIAQTAHALSGDKEKALSTGCNDYVSKPIEKEELLGKIRRLLKA